MLKPPPPTLLDRVFEVIRKHSHDDITANRREFVDDDFLDGVRAGRRAMRREMLDDLWGLTIPPERDEE